MKAVQKVEPKPGAVYHDVIDPEIGDNDILVKIKAAAFCKSDVDVYEWSPGVAAANYKLPFTMGHEYCGEVVELGKNVTGFEVGDHVAGETHVPCGYCYTCRTGNQHICGNNMGIVGRNVHGSFAELMRVPDVAAVKVDKDMPFKHGALMEPLGVALHALQVAEVSGKTVAVYGCGTIGRMAVEMAKILGATKVFGISTTKKKLDDALEHGADVVINSKTQSIPEVIMKETRGRGVAVGIETTGNQKIINDMIRAMQIAGICVLFGTIDYPLTFEIQFTREFIFKELLLTGIFGRLMYSTWELLKDILESGRMDPSHYVGEEISLKDIDRGVEIFQNVLGRIVMYP
jgi:threonine 3-dehydrogenase